MPCFTWVEVVLVVRWRRQCVFRERCLLSLVLLAYTIRRFVSSSMNSLYTSMRYSRECSWLRLYYIPSGELAVVPCEETSAGYRGFWLPKKKKCQDLKCEAGIDVSLYILVSAPLMLQALLKCCLFGARKQCRAT